MFKAFFRNISVFVLVLTALGAAAAAGSGWRAGSLAIAVGAAWAFLNGFLLFELLAIAANQTPERQDKILIFSILKFPVLYLAGYFILKSRFFPVAGILAGLTIFLAAVLAAWLGMHFDSKRFAGSAS